VTSVGCTSGLQQIFGREYFQGIVEVWFYHLYGYWGTRLSSYFGGFVLVGGFVFPSELMKLTRLYNINFCLMYVLMIHL
jgi:hypothetical protein